MSDTTTPNFSTGANQAGDAIKKGVNDLLEMQENTAITLLTFLTFLTIIMAFLYYFYFNGTGTIGGIALIIIIVVMFSVVGNALMGSAGVAAGCVIGIIVGIAIYTRMINSKSTRNCNMMNEVYGTLNTAISNVDLSKYDGCLYDYYIKTAYNCCSGGNYKNDYVSMCSLQDILKQGVRGLDFEIYSIDDQPVVATSTVDNFCVKETFNYVNFSDVINTIVNNAFTETVPNPNDPIIIHLRIKSENTKMYKNLSDIFGSITQLLMTNYTYENMGANGPQNFGAVKLSEMLGKIVIIVDKNNTTCLCEDCSETDECGDFYEFVNMTSNSSFMQLLRYGDIQYTQTPDDLINQNRQAMTIGIPDKGPNPPNPSSAVMRSLGVQMLAMRYQSVDANVEENDLFFNDNKSAFVLKPANMRAITVTIPDAKPQDPALYYTSRTITSPFYNLNV